MQRLRTTYIDIYQVHWPDPLVPVEETAETMRRFYEEGKIRAIGVSNFSPEAMDRFRAVAPSHRSTASQGCDGVLPIPCPSGELDSVAHLSTSRLLVVAERFGPVQSTRAGAMGSSLPSLQSVDSQPRILHPYPDARFAATHPQ